MSVGVTGHQELPDARMWDWVGSAIDHEIARLPKPLTGVTCLAVGADQVFARSVLKNGGCLLHVKPFSDYERTFEPKALREYLELSKGAVVDVLSVCGSDEDAFFAAGKRVVDRSECLFAIWDGEPARGKGGTADIVAYATKKRVPIVHFNPIQRLRRRT